MIRDLRSTEGCDLELLAILETHILELKPSEKAVAMAFEAIQALAETRAQGGGADA